MAAPIARTTLDNVKLQLNDIVDVTEYIINKNINNYKFNNITGAQLYQAIALVSLLDYYNTYNGDKNTKIKILQRASSLIQELLKSLGSTPTPGINNSSRPGQSDLTGLLTNAITEVDTEMKTLLQKKPNHQKVISMSAKSEVNPPGVPNPAGVIIKFDEVETCAGEGCFYTKDQFNTNIKNINDSNLPIKITLNSLDDTSKENIIDITTLMNIINSKDFSYKVFGTPNPNTKKIIQDLNDALGDEFNDKTTYRLETIQETSNVYGFTIELLYGSSVTLNDKHKGLTKLEVLLQYTCQKDLSKLTAEEKPNSKIIENFTSLLETLKLLHEQNIVHLDIKLQNIMKCDNTFRFIDFAIGKIDENTDNFITTYHISTNNRLDYTQYIMETWMKLDKDKRNKLIPLALPIFKLTDLFCLLFAYLSMMNVQGINNYLKPVVTDEDSKVKGNTIIDIDHLYKDQLQNSSQDSILYNFKQQINNAVKEFQSKEGLIDELSLEKDKLNLTKLIKLVGQAGGKSKKKKQRGGVNAELVDTIKKSIEAQELSISDENLKTDIKNLLENIPEDFQTNNKDILENFITFRYLSNHYIPTKIETEEDFNTKLNHITKMNKLIKHVVSTVSNKEATSAAAQEKTIATDINTKQNNKSKKKVTRDSNVVGGSSKVQSFFNQYKNAFFVSPLKPAPIDKIIYVYRLDKIVSVTNRTLEVSRYKIDLEKNPTVSLKNLKSKKFQVVLSKDNKRLKLEKNYLVPL